MERDERVPGNTGRTGSTLMSMIMPSNMTKPDTSLWTEANGSQTILQLMKGDPPYVRLFLP